MKITRTAAIAMFVAFGFKIAEKWDDAKLNKRISQIPDQVDEDALKNLADEAVKKDVKDVLAALEKGEEVTVEVEDAPKAKAEKPAKAAAEDEGEEKPKAKTKDAGDKAVEKVKASAKKDEPAGDEKPAAKPAAKAKKEEAAVDKFNNRIGSQAANINAALAKKWITIADVAAATKLSEARVRSHGKYLEGRKLAEYDAEKGIRLL